ncbi:MAG: tetratricopeptide repeat protein [bacterium]
MFNLIGSIINIQNKTTLATPFSGNYIVDLIIIIFIIVKLLRYLIYYYENKGFFSHPKKIENKNEWKDAPDFIKNIYKQKNIIREIYKEFKIKANLQQLKAFKNIYDDKEVNNTILVSDIKRFIEYCKVNDKDELDVEYGGVVAISYIISTLFAFAMICLGFYYILNDKLNKISSLYKENFNVYQILTYYKSENHSLFLVADFLFFLAIIFFILFLFKLIKFIDIFSFKKSLDNYYERVTKNDTKNYKKFKKWSISIILIFLLIYILLLGFSFSPIIFKKTAQTANMSIMIINKKCKIKTVKIKSSYMDNKGIICDNFGVKYYAGIGVLKDYKKAFNLFKKSANKNNPYGQLNLGYMYAEGKGTAKNLSNAKLYIDKAFYNPKTNLNIRLLARKVWHQYKLWRYSVPKINSK